METTLWIIIGLALLAIILWVYAIADIIKGSLSGSASKVLWLIAVIIFPILGAVLYLILGSKGTSQSDHGRPR